MPVRQMVARLEHRTVEREVLEKITRDFSALLERQSNFYLLINTRIHEELSAKAYAKNSFLVGLFAPKFNTVVIWLI